jgi:hypothetical protein
MPHPYESRLPDGWSTPELVEDVIVVDDLTIHRAGVAARAPDGQEICGSAADPAGPALARAWFELLERVSTVDALRDRASSYSLMNEEGRAIDRWSAADVFPESDEPARWRYARSNGVAIHVGWQAACRRALWELVERHRVIRAWHGTIVPTRIDLDLDGTPLARVRTHEWRVCSFPDDELGAFASGAHVVGVFGFPKDDGVPFVLGFAGRPERKDAIVAAIGEAVQLLAFLWGEPPPQELPSHPGPMLHLDRYQLRGAHALVRGWLDGAHVRYRGGCPAPYRQGPVGFVDLTPSWLPDGLRVVKAVCREAAPLVFGESPFARHLPPALRFHPIP